MGHSASKHLNRHPSGGCKQKLSTTELVQRTQEDRVRRFAKKQAGG